MMISQSSRGNTGSDMDLWVNFCAVKVAIEDGPTGRLDDLEVRTHVGMLKDVDGRVVQLLI